MSKQIAQALAAPFDPKDLKTRPGRSGMTYTYADVRAIDTRLDEVFGTMGWSFSWEVVDAENYVVRGRLIVGYEGASKTIEEAGYPNAAGRDEEPLKSSVTDSRRRAAAALGIGRSLYSPDKGINTPPRPAPSLSVAQIRVPEASSGLTEDQIVAAKAAMLFAADSADGECSHGTAWTLKPGGIAKVSGKPYQPFWTASHKMPDGGFCKDKPSIKWLASHPVTEPNGPKEDLESLPF
jgi:hypothetical protein